MLYENGWSGLNIDMNQTFIDLFNLKRRKDLNICCALSNIGKKVTAYIDHYFSPINTLNKNYSDFAEKNISFRTHKKTHIETKTFETLVKNANINVPKIDFLNIGGEAFLTQDDGITLIEWADIIKKILPSNVITINFSILDGYPNSRQIEIIGILDED